MEDIDEHISSQVQALLVRKREDVGLSQQKLAEQIGCSQSYLSQVERGRRPVSARIAMLLCDALGLAPRDFRGAMRRRGRPALTCASRQALARIRGARHSRESKQRPPYMSQRSLELSTTEYGVRSLSLRSLGWRSAKASKRYRATLLQSWNLSAAILEYGPKRLLVAAYRGRRLVTWLRGNEPASIPSGEQIVCLFKN